MKSVILEWSKFLEIINTLPRLIAKVQSADVSRSKLKKYEGIFKNGAWHGKGNFYFPDGEKWVGEFREDQPWDVTW